MYTGAVGERDPSKVNVRYSKDVLHGFVDACREMDEYTLDSSVRSSLPPDIPESIPVLDLGKRVTGSEFPDPKRSIL